MASTIVTTSPPRSAPPTIPLPFGETSPGSAACATGAWTTRLEAPTMAAVANAPARRTPSRNRARRDAAAVARKERDLDNVGAIEVRMGLPVDNWDRTKRSARELGD